MDYVPLFQTLAWIIVIVFLAYVSRKDLKRLSAAVVKRVEKGGGVKLGPFELPADLQALPFVAGGASAPSTPALEGSGHPELSENPEDVGVGDESERETAIPFKSTGDLSLSEFRKSLYNQTRRVFLVHVIQPSQAKDQTYDVFIYLFQHKHGARNLMGVERAEFYLGPYWGDRVFPAENTGEPIGIRTSAYGSALCVCRVTFTDGYQVLLHRYIDLEMGRVEDAVPRA
jgi:prokaryotic YEATS domain